MNDINSSWMADHIPAARDAARRELEELEKERAKQEALAKTARDQTTRQAEQKRLTELANSRAKKMAQDTSERLRQSSIDCDERLAVKVTWIRDNNWEMPSHLEWDLTVGRAWVLRQPHSYTEGAGEDMRNIYVPGLWLDDSGSLRAVYPWNSRLMRKPVSAPEVSIDKAYPLAVWGENGEPLNYGPMGHCDTCGPGTPFITGPVRGYRANPDDKHGMLLARHLTILLARHNLL